MNATQAILASILRTVVPAAVGLVVSVNVFSGVDTDALEVVLTGLITGAYYAVIRVLETQVSSRFGWLLGFARTPSYDS